MCEVVEHAKIRELQLSSKHVSDAGAENPLTHTHPSVEHVSEADDELSTTELHPLAEHVSEVDEIAPLLVCISE